MIKVQKMARKMTLKIRNSRMKLMKMMRILEMLVILLIIMRNQIVQKMTIRVPLLLSKSRRRTTLPLL